MNRFVDILNRIRQHANLEWLTPSQQKAYSLVCERLNFLDEVNLWGRHGVGKTFVGWMLRTQSLADYMPRLEEIKDGKFRYAVVVDNVSWRRREVREVLHHYREQGYKKIVLITTEPVQDQMSTVELQLTNEDLKKVITNLRSIRVMPFSATPRNIWDLVSPVELTS